MKPLNQDDPGCNYTSSNCVIWQGPDIPCINLCQGDSVSTVVYKLATELCNVLDTLNVTNYDLSCLSLSSPPANFHDFIQVLVNTICSIRTGVPLMVSRSGMSDTLDSTSTMPIAPCFYYRNSLGDLVTTMTIDDYVTAIGNWACNADTSIKSIERTVANHTQQITVLSGQVQNLIQTTTQDNDLITPTCVLPSTPVEPQVLIQALERQFCQLVSATGSPSQLFAAIAQQCNALSTDKSLSGSGNMGSIPGWNADLLNLAAAVNNLWLTICDMRSAVKNIQLNYLPSGCEGIAMNLTANLSGSNLVLFITGTVPPGFVNCASAGSQVTITDDNGGSVVTNIDLVTYVNNISGYTIGLSTTPINLSSNIHVNIAACLKNVTTGSQCQSILSYTYSNVSSCPAMTYTPATDSIAYSGTSLPGTSTYTIELYNSAGTSLISSQAHVVTGPAPITGTFTSLALNTNYRLRVVVTNSVGTLTNCPFAMVSLLPVVLLPISLSTADAFAVLAGGGITNSSTSAITGNVGSDPTNTVTGLTSGMVTGHLYTSSDPAVISAKVSLVNAYADAISRTPAVAIAHELGGTTLTSGIYNCTDGYFQITGTLTLDGADDPNAVFIFQTTTTFTTADASTITLINGAQAKNIFFQVGSTASIGHNATFKGNVLSTGNITVNRGANIAGRVLSKNGTVTLDTNTITLP